MIHQTDLQIASLGEALHDSPLEFGSASHTADVHFVSDAVRLQHTIEIGLAAAGEELSYEEAGPREKIFFDPKQTSAAIVTCGGLSPGLNNVIRSAFYELTANYGVPRVLGIRNGYLGLNPESGRPAHRADQGVRRTDRQAGRAPISAVPAGRRSRR